VGVEVTGLRRWTRQRGPHNGSISLRDAVVAVQVGGRVEARAAVPCAACAQDSREVGMRHAAIAVDVTLQLRCDRDRGTRRCLSGGVSRRGCETVGCAGLERADTRRVFPRGGGAPGGRWSEAAVGAEILT